MAIDYLTDDQLHELLNAGLGEAKVEVLAAVPAHHDDRVSRAEIAAISGMAITTAKNHLAWLLDHRFVRVQHTSKAKRARYWLNAEVFAHGVEMLPMGTRMNAEDPDVREQAYEQYERRAAS